MACGYSQDVTQVHDRPTDQRVHASRARASHLCGDRGRRELFVIVQLDDRALLRVESLEGLPDSLQVRARRLLQELDIRSKGLLDLGPVDPQLVQVAEEAPGGHSRR